jgi:hypothetical protein
MHADKRGLNNEQREIPGRSDVLTVLPKDNGEHLRASAFICG